MHIEHSNVASFITLYDMAQCTGKNDRRDEGPILGCTNVIGDPKLAVGKQWMRVLCNVGNASLPRRNIRGGKSFGVYNPHFIYNY